MKSLFILLVTVGVSTICLLFLASCSQNNLAPLAPAAQTAFSLASPNPTVSPIEAAIATNPSNKNPEKFAPAKILSAQPFVTTASVTTPIYTVTDLGTFGGEFSAALDINASGQIVGAATMADGAYRPFLYENGQLSNLGTLGGNYGTASGINEVGEIIGQSDNAQNVRHGFLYHNGALTDIGTLGGSECRASDINASGSIVGSASTFSNERHAFLYENGQMHDLGTLGGSTSWANNINVSGQIVGGSHTLPNQSWHAYLRNNGIMTDLGTFVGGLQSVAFGQNDIGQIVGWSDMAGSTTLRAALWSNGTITDLGTLGGESIAYNINNSGQVVGHAFTADNRQHAFLINGGPMKDLNDLIPANSGWELDIAINISQDGRKIVGRGISNGQRHAFLLTLNPTQGINYLIDLVYSFKLPQGTETSLITKLQHALDDITTGDACNDFTAFINEVNAQAGKKLTLEQANQLLAAANQIQTALGCP